MADPTPTTSPVDGTWTDVTDKLYNTAQSVNGFQEPDQRSFHYQNDLSRANRQAGGDIPPNSPLAQGNSTPRFWGSLAQSIGLPTQTSQLPMWAASHAIGPAGPAILQAAQGTASLLRDHSITGINNALNPMAMPMTQAGEKNWSGLAGSLTPLIGMMAAGKFMPEAASPTPRVPIQMEAAKAGPFMQTARNVLGFAIPEKILNAFDPLLKGSGTKTIQVPFTETPPPVKYSGTDFPLNSARLMAPVEEPAGSMPLRTPEEGMMLGNAAQFNVRPASVGSAETQFPFSAGKLTDAILPQTPKASLPLNPPENIQLAQNWAKISGKDTYTGKAPPTADASFGNALKQPFLNPKRPSTKAGWNARNPTLETSGEAVPSNFKDNYVHELDAKPGTILAANSKTGQVTFVDSVDNGHAWVVTRGPNGILSQRPLPIRMPKSAVGKALTTHPPEGEE